MLTVSILLLTSLILAFSKYGRIKLGHDDEKPEFSTMSWLTMMFAAGMGVGLLFYGAAEPISHLLLLVQQGPQTPKMANEALFITLFNWGLHAWAIYGVTALVIAYFGFRKNTPQLISGPIRSTFGDHPVAVGTGWVVDLLAIYAIAIGLAGFLAMGVFQVEDGVASLFNLGNTGMRLTLTIFVVLCAAYIFPLMLDLSKGMAVLSNTALSIAVGLLIYLLLLGPTSFLIAALPAKIVKKRKSITNGCFF